MLFLLVPLHNLTDLNRLLSNNIATALYLGKSNMQPIGMLVVLDSILNRITANRTKGKNTYIFIDRSN